MVAFKAPTSSLIVLNISVRTLSVRTLMSLRSSYAVLEPERVPRLGAVAVGMAQDFEEEKKVEGKGPS